MLKHEAVLKRYRHLRASGLSAADADIILDQIVAAMAPVDLCFLWRPLLRDSEDDMVLETAVNGGADTIVSFNIRDFRYVPSRFGIALIRPGELLRRL